MLVYPLAITMSLAGLVNAKAYTQAWWVRWVSGPAPRKVVRRKKILSDREAMLLHNAAIRGLDVMNYTDRQVIAKESDIASERILEYVDQNPYHYQAL